MSEPLLLGWDTFRHRSVDPLTRPGENVALVRAHEPGERFDLGPEFKEIILGFGRPGVLRGWDHRGMAYQEVRTFDFACWPNDMPERAKRKLRRLVHNPEWVLISGNGMKASQPVTGKWVRRDDKDFDRLSRLPVVGEVGRQQ